MTNMMIAMWIFGTVLAQVVIAVSIDKYRRKRSRLRAVEAGVAFGLPERAPFESAPPDVAKKTYANLSALLIALSPETGLAQCDLRSELESVLAALSPGPDGNAPTKASTESARTIPKG